MSTRGKQLVLIAFFVALAMVGILYLLSQPRPRRVLSPLEAAWWDDFEDDSTIHKDESVFRHSDGIRLSRVHDLGSPVLGASVFGDMIIGPDGRLFGTVYISGTRTTHLFTYEPSDDEFIDHGELVSESDVTVMAFGEDGRLYVGATPLDQSEQAFLLAYDLESAQVQRVDFPFSGKRKIRALVMTSNGAVYGAAGDHLFRYDQAEDSVTDLGVPLGAVDILGLVLGGNGQLYGLGDHRAPYLFEYDLESRAVITLTGVIKVDVNSIWYNDRDNDIGLVMAKDGKLYAEAEDWWLLCYDPDHNAVTIEESLGHREWHLSIRELTAGADGAICGIASSYYKSRVFCYSPTTGDLVYPDGIYARDGYDNEWKSELAVSADEFIYVSQEKWSTHVPVQAKTLSLWADLMWELERRLRGGSGTPPPPTAKRVAYQEMRLLAYKPEAYVAQGSVESELIEPHPLVVTHTQVTHRWRSIAGLAWGSDGALYGAISPPPYSEPGQQQSFENWFFRYSPEKPQRVEWMEPWSHGTTTLVGTPDGHLVAAVGPHLVSYNPVNDTVLTATLPFSSVTDAAVLAAGQDGYVYGSTRQDGPSHLFAYNPTEGEVIDLGTPFTTTAVIRALTVAPDGRLYGGASSEYAWNEPIHVYLYAFAYDPATQSTTRIPGGDGVRALLAGPDGRIYFGTGSGNWAEPDGGLLVYDPVAHVVTGLPLPATSRYGGARENVVSLALGSDGLLYGSMGEGYVFVYDPRAPSGQPRPIATAIGTDLILLAGPDGVMYGAVGSYDSYYATGASLIAFSTKCTSGAVGAWERVTWEAETPPGTRIVVDVLDEEGNTVLRNVKNGGPLWRVDPVEHSAIRLRATLFTKDERVTPVLKSWRVDYTFECQK